MICIVNGVFKPVEQATISIQDLAVIRGYGIFDFFRLSSGIPLFLEDHLDRFFQGAGMVRLHVGYSRSELRQQIEELIRRNDQPESGIRMVLTGGTGGGSYGIGQPNLVITQEPISFPTKTQYENGVKLVTHDYRRDLPAVKTINYMMGIWMQEEVRSQNAFDVLYSHGAGIHEATRSNLFIVSAEGKLVTPKEDILHGITRKHVLTAARQRYPVEERPVTLPELMNAKEAFLTGTTKRVLPVVQIDGAVIGDGNPGPVTQDLMRRFSETAAEYVESRRDLFRQRTD